MTRKTYCGNQVCWPAGDVCSDWRLKLSEDKKKILAVPPGLIIIFK